MGDLRYDPRALHIGPFTGTEMGIAQVPANEKLLIAALDASIRTAEYHADLAERSGSGSADARYRAVKLPYLRGVVSDSGACVVLSMTPLITTDPISTLGARFLLRYSSQSSAFLWSRLRKSGVGR